MQTDIGKAPTSSKPLRIICLHGFTASKEFMSYQLEGWRKAFNGQMEFIPLDGKFEIPNDREWIPNNKQVQKWHEDKNIPLHSNIQVGLYYEIYNNSYYNMDYEMAKITFTHILEVINNDEQGIDGFLAFSQGGYSCYSFFSCLERGLLAPLLKTRKIPYFVILVNPQPQPGFYQSKVPSLHFYGELDEAFTASQLMLTKFKQPEYMIFPEAHKLPEVTLKLKKTLKKFLANQSRQKYLGQIEQVLVGVKL